MKAFIFRGQSTGLMLDMIYARLPKKEDIQTALAYELERHGVVFDRDADGMILGAKARERWVRIQAVEVMGADLPELEFPEGFQMEFRGTLSDLGLRKAVEGGSSQLLDVGGRVAGGSAGVSVAAEGTAIVTPPEEKESNDES